MSGFIVSFLVGIVCVVLGISNMRGNISSLHSYHRHRVSEEDRPAFGKLVGLGTILCGCGVMVFSVFSGIYLYIESQIIYWTGTGLLIAFLAAGLGLNFYAMIKYNKGIF